MHKGKIFIFLSFIKKKKKTRDGPRQGIFPYTWLLFSAVAFWFDAGQNFPFVLNRDKKNYFHYINLQPASEGYLCPREN